MKSSEYLSMLSQNCDKFCRSFKKDWYHINDHTVYEICDDTDVEYAIYHMLRQRPDPFSETQVHGLADLWGIATSQRIQQPDHLIAFNNGFTIDWTIGTPGDPRSYIRKIQLEDYIIQTLGCSYDPEYVPTPIPIFESILGSPGNVEVFLSAIGQALDRRTACDRLVWIVGSPGTGKSSLTRLLEILFGQEGYAAGPKALIKPRDPLAPNPTLASLVERSIGIVNDAENALLDESIIKAVTGGDTITVRRLYKDQTEVRSHALIVVTSNSLPKISGDDTAIMNRRLLPFQCTNVIHAEKRLRLEDVMTMYIPDLQWIVEQAIMYRSLNDGLMDILPEQEDVITQIKIASDPLSDFLQGFEITDQDVEFIKVNDFMDEYTRYTGDEKVNQISLSRKLVSHGCKIRRSRHGNDRYRMITNLVRLP